MPHNQEIRTIAQRWVERYDEQALAEALQRMFELKEHGANEAYILWLEVYSEAESLLEAKRTRH